MPSKYVFWDRYDYQDELTPEEHEEPGNLGDLIEHMGWDAYVAEDPEYPLCGHTWDGETPNLGAGTTHHCHASLGHEGDHRCWCTEERPG